MIVTAHRLTDQNFGERVLMTKHPDMYKIEDRGFTTPCWVWLRATAGGGYGVIRRDFVNQQAHRYFYEQIHGLLPRHIELDHLCRIRLCVNPEHLEPVTHAENGRRGSRAKLDWDRVRRIRELASDGALHTEIAVAFNVAPRTISSIVAGDRWKEDGGS